MFTIGQVISNYKIIDTLGKPGGYGQAHKVKNISDNSEAALKECFGKTTDDLLRFDGENDILYILQAHNYIIKPLSRIALEGATKYYLMELADENLEDFLNRNYNLSVDEKIALFIKICEGIEYAHSKKVVHRDIWWKNVLIVNQSSFTIPKLTDFGRSRDFGISQITLVPPEKWGLPDIGQPELYFKYWESPSQQNYIVGDIFALGILFYYSLGVNQLLYPYYLVPSAKKFLNSEGININTADEAVRQKAYRDWLSTIDYALLEGLRQLPSYTPAFVKKIDPIIGKMSNPDFSLRYQSVSELLTDLRSI